jgi:hypothetical protein
MTDTTSKAYTDRLTKIASLRNQSALIKAQLDDEIAKAWLLAPASKTRSAFAHVVGLTLSELNTLLTAKGVR